MGGFASGLDVLLAVIAVGTAVVSWFRWVRPRIRARRDEREATNEVLLGRPAVPANPITGAPAQPEKPAIGKQVADMAALLVEVHHELHPNNGSSMKDALGRAETEGRESRQVINEILERLTQGDRRFEEQAERLGRIETVLTDELRVATDTVANAAEASKTALKVIDAALMADPPADLG